MKKSTFWLLLSIFWTIDALIAIVRFFDVHIVVRGKEDRWVKEISREGDKPTPLRIMNAALALLLCNLYCAMFFKARNEEKRLTADGGQMTAEDGE